MAFHLQDRKAVLNIPALLSGVWSQRPDELLIFAREKGLCPRAEGEKTVVLNDR